MKIKKETLFLVGLVILIAVALIWTVSTMAAGNNYYGQDYQKAVASENKEDVCATPAGYTDAEWKEHLGHHPDQYAQCL